MTGDSVQFQCFDDVISLVRGIVADAKSLCDEHLEERDLPVNYAAIFTQSEEEYRQLDAVAQYYGQEAETTATGQVYRVKPFDTVAGTIELIKIRKPDPTRKERGYADFTVPEFQQFKSQHLHSVGFRHIVRESYEMLELHVDGSAARAYFTYPTTEQRLRRIKVIENEK